MADRTGLRRRAGPPVFFGACLLRTQATEQPSVAMEPSCERPMEEIPGLARRAIRRALLSQFHLVMHMPAQLWVTRAQLCEQRMPEYTGLVNQVQRRRISWRTLRLVVRTRD